MQAPTGSHVFERRDSGLAYDLDESDADYFPGQDVLASVEEETSNEVVDIFPLEFSMYAHDDSNTRELLHSVGLPADDEGLINLFWYYPGELEIHGVINRMDGEYTFEPTAIEYEGKRFIPEE